jgi:hypothetical protein
LRAFEVSLDKAARLWENILGRFIKIAESRVRSKRDIEKLAKKEADAFLVGTTLMKDPAKIYELVGTSWCGLKVLAHNDVASTSLRTLTLYSERGAY